MFNNLLQGKKKEKTISAIRPKPFKISNERISKTFLDIEVILPNGYILSGNTKINYRGKLKDELIKEG